MVSGLINENPVVYEKKERRRRIAPSTVVDEYGFGSLTFLHHIRDIQDPEHPYSLEDLKVITEDAIEVNDRNSYVRVTFTPTVKHCSMATLIGLCLRAKLMRSLPPRFKIDQHIDDNSFCRLSAYCVLNSRKPSRNCHGYLFNKQLNDKERVAAVLENPNMGKVDELLAPSYGE
ncbi:hypothetical protein ACFE04_004984 [Oxalis oulophora]